jgi:hypothetical protein
MRDQLAERRQTEEMTSSVLRTIEDTLGTILDRVDRLDPDGFGSFSGNRERHEGAGTSPLDPLLEAYAQGARALGQVTPATLLDAADYTTSGRRSGRPDFDRSQEPAWKEPEAESKLTRMSSRPRPFPKSCRRRTCPPRRPPTNTQPKLRAPGAGRLERPAGCMGSC